jgi:hypothetical protein
MGAAVCSAPDEEWNPEMPDQLLQLEMNAPESTFKTSIGK